jgi:demethylmenaquinone methyltransferase / 2-methoxy-6-polyprenyl-1,4-benzoquinol methylase
LEQGQPVSAASLDKSEVRVRRMFGAIAPVYDTLNHLLSLNVDRYWRWRTTQLAPPRGTDPILDVCTGTGDLALAYLKAADSGVQIVGSDFCADMLALANKKIRPQKAMGRIKFIQADTQTLPFPENYFQIVCVGFGLRNVTDTDKGLAEMTRVAKPGGRVVVLEFSKPRNSFFNRCYQWYFQYVLPLIGQTISRSRDMAYKYLPNSVKDFPDGESLLERFRHQGLINCTWTPLTLGIASVYVGEKP